LKSGKKIKYAITFLGIFVDFGTGMLGVTMPFSYVASPSTFTSSSLNDIGNRTLFVYLDWSVPVLDSAKWLCQLPFGSYVQDIAYNSEINILLGKAREINGDC
jgi:hypothetical protein